MSRVSISVNGLSLVHEDSGGVSTATLPDVCITPPSLAPAPYPNVARSRDLAGGSCLVRADGGHRIATSGSTFARSTGGEPGAGGGVTSGTTGAEATFLTHSFDVAIEGRGACRLTDKMLHNRGNTIDCSGVLQPHIGRARVVMSTPPKKKGRVELLDLPGGKVTRRLGVDTNLKTLNAVYARSQHRHFVGRYLAAHDNGSSDGELDPETGAVLHPGLTKHEVERLHRGKMKVFAIWEKQKFHAISDVDGGRKPPTTCSMRRQLDTGIGDATKAAEQMQKVNAPGGRPIYFTVDFTITPFDMSKRRLRDVETHELVLYREVLAEYFVGVNSVIGKDRTGAYGGYLAIKYLFDKGLIGYGWQMTFPVGAPPEPVKIDHRAHLQQYDVQAPQLVGPNQDQPLWGVQGMGALDYDRSLRDDFGQW
jgi:hypothetical protein